MTIEMVIKGLMWDPVSRTPIVVLKDTSEKNVLPIWVGDLEADAIHRHLEGATPPRPFTHELLLDSIRTLGGTVERIVITDLKDGTFYAELRLTRGDESFTVDARPSDAMALAQRAGASIFVAEAVLEKSTSPDYEDSDQTERLRRWLEEVDLEELGNYEM